MGTSLNGLTPAGTYPGLIKTGDNAPIDGTLKTLSDGNGNNLPMAVSTTAVNFTNQLQQGGVAVPTASQVNAKQDTLVSGTNIKTINGTSVLGSGNIVTPSTPPSGVAGAIQFTDGSAFASDAANLFWNNTTKRLGVGTNAPTQALDVIGAGRFYQAFAAGIPSLFAYNGRSEVDSTLRLENAGGGRLYFGGVGLLTESNVAFGQLSAPSARVHIKGSGTTSGTTALLVQNSAGTERFKVTDNGVSTFTPASAYTVAITTGNNGVIRSAGGYENADGVYGADSGLFLRAAGNMYITANNGNTASFGLFGTGSGFNIGTGLSVDASAVLNLNSTNRGFLPPRMTTTQKNAIATPASGLVVYDSTTNKLCCYNGSTWNDLF